MSDTPRKEKRLISLRLIVTVALTAMISATLLGAGWMAERATQNMLSGEIETRLKLQARNLAQVSSGALLSDYPELTLHPLVKDMQLGLPEQAFVIVLDHEGRIQGHRDARSLGETYVLDPALKVQAVLEGAYGDEVLLSDGKTLVVDCPVLHPNGARIGSAIVGLNSSYLDAMVWNMRLSQLPLLGGILIVGLVMALILASTLLRPIAKLRAGLMRIGRGDLDTPVRLKDRTELGMLANSINDMCRQLKSAQAELLEKDRLAHEMELANDIQSHLLPAGDLHAGVCQVTGAHRPAAEVGGDYYDYFELPDGRLGIAIADVSGKGLAGCLIMSMLSTLLRTLGPNHSSPSKLLVLLEERLSETLKVGQFITMFYGILDSDTGHLIYASAAHSPVLICRGGRDLEWEDSEGIPLGAVPGGALATTLEDRELQLEPGDMLVQFTDGVNEAFNEREEQFDFAGIERAVVQGAANGPAAVLASLSRAVKDWIGSDGEPFDDETILVIGRAAAPASPGEESIGKQGMSSGPSPEQEETTVQTSGGAVLKTATRAHPVGDAKALRLLQRASDVGRHLRLPADLSALTQLGDWLAGLAEMREGCCMEVGNLENALWETCANIIEHGYDLDATRSLDLWYIPSPVDESQASDDICMAILLRDRGRSYKMVGEEEVDFHDPSVRLKGRGIGREIIRRVVRVVTYFPGTDEGNLTLLEFGKNIVCTEREKLNA